jgi:hypothetical protein
VLIVLIHCKVVRCEYKGERGNTYVLFNLERSHDIALGFLTKCLVEISAFAGEDAAIEMGLCKGLFSIVATTLGIFTDF